MEIGSEFWLDQLPEEKSVEIYRQGDTSEHDTFTASGRSAFSLLLKKVKPKYNKILMPAYLCNSMILPFKDLGYQCSFYEIDQKLEPVLSSVRKEEQVGIFLHMGYFGYPTNEKLQDAVKEFKENQTIIVEDITHTLFSHYPRFQENDFTVASIRKWMGIPSGGILTSASEDTPDQLLRNMKFTSLRTKALLLKGDYMRKQKEYSASVRKEQKEACLDLFSKAEELLSEDSGPYEIDQISMKIWRLANLRQIVIKRRKNYAILLEGVKKLTYLKPVFDQLPKEVCPMFFPVYLPKDRSFVRKRLTMEEIYCPIHWEVPELVDLEKFPETAKIYSSILSIPCDQRYGPEDMKRVVEVLRDLEAS